MQQKAPAKPVLFVACCTGRMGLTTYGVFGSAFDRVPEGTELWGVEINDEFALFGAILAGVVAAVIAGSTVGKDIALR